MQRGIWVVGKRITGDVINVADKCQYHQQAVPPIQRNLDA